MNNSIVEFIYTVYYSWYYCIMYRFEYDDAFYRRCFWEEINWGWHEMYDEPRNFLLDDPTLAEVFHFFFPYES